MPDLDQTTVNTAQTTREKIDALNAQAWTLRDLDAEHCVELAQSALALARDEQYPHGIADGLVCSGHANFWLGNIPATISQALKALDLYQQLGDLAGQSNALRILCWVQWNLNNYAEAVELGQRARALAQQCGNRSFEGHALIDIGMAYRAAGDCKLAFSFLNQARTCFHQIGDSYGEIRTLINLSLTLDLVEDYEQSLATAQESLRAQEETQERTWEGYVYRVLGQAYAGLGNYDLAFRYLNQSLEFARAHSYIRLILSILSFYSKLYRRLDQIPQAIDALRQTLEMAHKLDSSLYQYECHLALAEIYEQQADWQTALAHYKKYQAAKERVYNDKNSARLQILQVQHQTEIARRETEIYHLRNVELENEIAERKRLEQELEFQATTDELTRIPNRRHFLAIAQIELKRAQRLHRALSLALLDLDHFKQINDTFGHAAGDQALTAFAQLCPQHIRGIDLFARFGGDEFALLLPETDETQSTQIIERMRQVLLAQPIQLGAQAVRMTLSIGIAALTRNDATIDALLARADQALYRAKENGRNQIQIAVSETIHSDQPERQGN